LLAAFQQEFNKTPDWLIAVKGREMWVAAEMRGGFPYTVIAPDMGVRIRFDRSSAKRKRTLRQRPLPAWSRYLVGSLAILARMGLEMPGATIVIAGDEPLGPRYDYNLGLAFAALWFEFNQREHTNQTLLDIMEDVQKSLEDAS
jgi:hypothetical protein